MTNQIHAIELSKIKPDPGQPRTEKPAEYIRDLGVSIAKNGQDNPIHVRPDPEHDGYYIIINGECRYLAHVNNESLCEQGTILAIIKEGIRSPRDLFLDQIRDNDNRLNMGRVETVKAYARAVEMGATPEDVAEAVGRKPAYIYEALTLAKLPADVLAAYDAGTLPKVVALEIAKQPTDARMGKAFRAAQKGKNSKDMLAKVQAYSEQADQQKLDAVMKLQDTPPDELKSAGKTLDKFMAAVNTFAKNRTEKGAIMVMARSKKLSEIEATAMEAKKQAEFLLENCRLYRARHDDGKNKKAA